MSETARDDDRPGAVRAGQPCATSCGKKTSIASSSVGSWRSSTEAFGVECGLIGPAPDIVAAILDHTPMAVTVAILALEWMSQDHYTQSVLDDRTIDPQFKALLKHHWEEELQHARIDERLLLSMADQSSREEIHAAVDGFFDIGGVLDAGLQQQAALDLASFQHAARRDLSEAQQAVFLSGQHQALRWTFLGTTMRNANFLGVLATLDEGARRRVQEAASVFAIH